jgi:hypothetical protein
MSEYYLADKRAAERAKQRELKDDAKPLQSQNIKVTLLGDFLFPAAEPQGCDPYNSTTGKSPRGDVWRTRRDRR